MKLLLNEGLRCWMMEEEKPTTFEIEEDHLVQNSRLHQ